MKTLSIVNSGNNWNLRIVDTGDRYGLDDCLVNSYGPIVEFYDKSQFVSSYYIATLLEDECPCGLNLDTASPEWYISAETMKEVIAFIKEFKSNVGS